VQLYQAGKSSKEIAQSLKAFSGRDVQAIILRICRAAGEPRRALLLQALEHRLGRVSPEHLARHMRALGDEVQESRHGTR